MPSIASSFTPHTFSPSRKPYRSPTSFSSKSHPTIAPVQLLYRDVLECVFAAAIEDEQDTLLQHRYLLTFSQVCFTWRLAALSLKSLWGRLVDFESFSWEWNNELLRRSYPHPISITSKGRQLPRHLNTISAELSHIHRIRSYRVSFNQSSWNVLCHKLRQPASSLENLDLSYVGSQIDGPLRCLPHDIFAGCAPHFRSLRLNRCWVDMSAPVLGSLTSLSVSNLPITLAPSISDWCSHLHRTPNLEELVLINSISSRHSPPPNDAHGLSSSGQHQPPVKLRFLSHLNINNSLQEVAALLQRLLIPIDCDIITGATNCRLGADLDVVCSTFSQALQYAYSLAPSFKPLRISLHGSGICLSNQPKMYGRYENGLSAQLPIHYLYLQSDTLSSWEELLPSILRCLNPTFDALTLFEPQLPRFHPILLGSLMRATNLDTFSNLTSCMTNGLLPNLQAAIASGGVPLPALQNIYFADDDSMWGPKYRTFVSFLRWRSSMDAPIRRVSFYKCSVLKDTIYMLESMGVVVDSDMGLKRWQNL